LVPWQLTSFLTQASNWGELWCTTNNKSKLEVTCASVSSDLVFFIGVFFPFFLVKLHHFLTKKLGNIFFSLNSSIFSNFLIFQKEIYIKKWGGKKIIIIKHWAGFFRKSTSQSDL